MQNMYTAEVNSALDAMTEYNNQPALSQWMNMFAGSHEHKYATLQSQFNQASALQTMQYNADEAQKNRDFQERMSSTAYQRGVADMKKAGINPIYAFSQGGASTPAGVSASSTASSASSPNSNSIEGPRLLMTLGLTVLDLMGQAGDAIKAWKDSKKPFGFGDR